MFYKNIKNQAKQFLGNYKSDNPATFAAAQQAIGGLLILDGFVGIDNPLGQNKRSGIFGSLLGVFLGLAFIFSTGFIGNLFGVNKMTAETTATVVSISQPTVSSGNSSGGSCTPRAKYTIDNKEYVQVSSSGSSSACSLTVGQTININYDPSNPGNWAYNLNAFKVVLKVFPIAGAVVAITSLFTFVIRLLSIIFGWKLLKSGRALAKTLPGGTDLSTIKNEVRQSFAKSIFGIGDGGGQPVTPAQPPLQPPTQLN